MKKEGQVRIPSGCAIAGIFSRSGERIAGDRDRALHRVDA